MTAVTESPLPPHNRELKTNKPWEEEGEVMWVLLWENLGVLSLLLERRELKRNGHGFIALLSNLMQMCVVSVSDV